MSGWVIGRRSGPTTVSSPTSAASRRRSTGSGSHRIAVPPSNVLLDHSTLHGTGASAAPGSRPALHCAAMADGSDESLAILARDADGSVERVPPSSIDDIDRLTDRPGSLVWVSVRAPDAEQVTALGREFRLHPLAMEDVRKRGQRP